MIDLGPALTAFTGDTTARREAVTRVAHALLGAAEGYRGRVTFSDYTTIKEFLYFAFTHDPTNMIEGEPQIGPDPYSTLNQHKE